MIPGEYVPMGTFTGTQVIDVPGEEHGTIQFVDGWKEGREQIFYSGGTPKKEYTYRHGKPTGNCSSWYDNGKLEHEAIIDEFTQTASYKWWARNGVLIYASSALHGLDEGLKQAWDSDGRKRLEGHYHAGHIEGDWREWDSEGSLDLEKSGVYSKGIRIGPLPKSDRQR